MKKAFFIVIMISYSVVYAENDQQKKIQSLIEKTAKSCSDECMDKSDPDNCKAIANGIRERITKIYKQAANNKIDENNPTYQSTLEVMYSVCPASRYKFKKALMGKHKK